MLKSFLNIIHAIILLRTNIKINNIEKNIQNSEPEIKQRITVNAFFTIRCAILA